MFVNETVKRNLGNKLLEEKHLEIIINICRSIQSMALKHVSVICKGNIVQI